MRGLTLVDDSESELTPDVDRPATSNGVISVDSLPNKSIEAEKTKEPKTMDVETRSIVGNTTLEDVMDTNIDAVLHSNCISEPAVSYAFDGD